MKLAPIFFGLVAAIAACAPPHEDEGDLVVEVRIPGKIVLSSVSLRVTGDGIAPIVEVVPLKVGQSSTLALFSRLPAPHHYRIAATAVSKDGATICTGFDDTDVSAHKTTHVSLTLQCTTHAGEATVNAVLHCQLIASLVVAPVTVSVGGAVDLSAALHADAGAAMFAWSSDSGTFLDPAGSSTKFVCGVGGTATITLNVSQGACTDQLTLSVTCVAGGSPRG